jgi:hypothetical protein
MFEKYNTHTKTIKDGIELDKLPFKPLKDFRNMTLTVDGFFFTQGKYGKQVVVVANGCKINMPARAVETFERIQADKNDLEGVLNGKLSLGNIKEKETKNGTTTIYELIG